MPAYTTQTRAHRQVGDDNAAVTQDRYDGDNSSTWAKNQLLKLSSGTLTPVLAVAGEIDATTDLTAATILFMAQTALTAASSDKQDVARIKKDARFWAPLLTSDSGASEPASAPVSIIGTQYELIQDSDGNIAPDKNAITAPVVQITAVESEKFPWKDSDLYKDSGGERYNFVEFKFLDSVVDNS